MGLQDLFFWFSGERGIVDLRQSNISVFVVGGKLMDNAAGACLKYQMALAVSNNRRWEVD
jgi:hypothetical protein